MKNKNFLTLAVVLAAATFASTASAEELVSVNTNVSVNASANIKSTSTGVRGNSTSSAAVSATTSATSSATTSKVRGNATSTAASTKNSATSSATSSMNHGNSTSSAAQTKNMGDNRSDVANFVRALLAASSTAGFGSQVSVIAHEQASSSEKTNEAVAKVESRGGFKTFFIGADYKNLGAIRSEISKTQARISQLNRELEKVATSSMKASIEVEIKALEADQVKLAAFVEKYQTKFSLFGWMNRSSK